MLQNVKLLKGPISGETKTSEGLIIFLFWKMMTSHENHEYLLEMWWVIVCKSPAI